MTSGSAAKAVTLKPSGKVIFSIAFAGLRKGTSAKPGKTEDAQISNESIVGLQNSVIATEAVYQRRCPKRNYQCIY
jgi:hypothetical protein